MGQGGAEMILEICLCALAAAAVLVLLWLLCAQFLLPVRTKNVYLLLLGRADGETLEQDCRAYLLLKNAGVIQRPLIIVDDGLNSDGQRLAAKPHSSPRIRTTPAMRRWSPGMPRSWTASRIPCSARSASASSPTSSALSSSTNRKLSIHKSFVIKIQINSIFTPKSLRMSNFCSTFAVGIKFQKDA
jgi:hypothetical protein